MAEWRGEADCPKCGGKGTLLVSGDTSLVHIDGCWVCGYGRPEKEGDDATFVPLPSKKPPRS